MKIVVKFELTEELRRRMRARNGRGGMATRREAKSFVEGAVFREWAALPAPKVRAPKKAEVERRTFDAPEASATPDVHRRRIARLYGHAEEHQPLATTDAEKEAEAIAGLQAHFAAEK